jgi:hypothetical protein
MDPPANSSATPPADPPATPPADAQKATLEARLAEVETLLGQFPGMMKRLIAQAMPVPAANPPAPSSPSAPAATAKPEELLEKIRLLEERSQTFEAEMEAMRVQTQQSQVESKLAAAMARHQLVEGVQPKEILTLLKGRVISENGKPFMRVTQTLPATGKTIEREVDLEEGVTSFFETNPGFLRGRLGPTVPANDQVGDPSTTFTSWEQLKDNPILLDKALRTEGFGRAGVERLQAAYNERKKERRRP